MSASSHIELERTVDSIRVGKRHRSDYGDIESLAESIRRQGLLQPITVTPDGVLVCGARRLAALRTLGVRKVNVWVRAGISERLSQLLAEQDDNTLHKPLTGTEAAALYSEAKALLAEDAARRQSATRFGADPLTSEPGPVTVTGPQGVSAGDARAQAAALVTGANSFTTLERIAALQRVADDETTDPAVRERAARALVDVDAGGPVKPAFREITGQLAAQELDKLAASEATSDDDRRAAALAATRLRSGTGNPVGEKPGIVARKALDRVRAAPRDEIRDAAAEVRRFTYVWNDLRDWWAGYDPDVIAAGVGADDWQHFETTLAGTLAFADAVRRRRDRTA